uniref:RecQ-mediated genome instability protein 1 n=1 Tax=Strongyloides papillosus TaxID=174720 RepID=A0A0N5BW38_STREA
MCDLEEAKRYFINKNINLRIQWLSQAIQFYNTFKLTGDINDFLVQNWLMCDIGESTIPKSLPILKNKDCDSSANHIFQINSVRRIDISFYSQYISLTEKKVDLSFFYGSNSENLDTKKESDLEIIDDASKKRCLMFELCDGKNTYFGIENEVIDFLSLSTPPGIKVHVKGPVAFQNNIFHLNKASIVLLGGKVESLCEYNKTMNILKRELKLIDSKSLDCLENKVPTKLSNNKIGEPIIHNIIPLNNGVGKNKFGEVKSHHTENIGIRRDKSTENIVNDITNSSCSSFDHFELPRGYNLNKHSVRYEVVNEKDKLLNVSTPKKDSIQATVLEDCQKKQFPLKDCHRISLTKDLENGVKHSSENRYSGNQQSPSKNVSSTHPFICENEKDRSLALFIPNKNINKSLTLDKDQETNINYQDTKSTLKRQPDRDSNFFDTSITSLKKIKNKDDENMLESKRIVSIQKAKELALISFGPYRAKVKGKVIAIVSGLTVKDNLWTMKILIKDGNETTLECLIDNKVIEEFIGLTAEEGLHLKKSNFTEQIEDAKNRLDCFHYQLKKSKNLVFSINIFNYSLIQPLIVKIETFEQFTHRMY